MAEELVSERRCAVTVVAMVTLEGPFHTPGAEEETLGQAGLKEELRQRWAPAELQEALWTLSGSQGCPLQ